MNFYSRKLIKPENLNARNTLFGGALLRWIDEEAGIYAMTKLDSRRCHWNRSRIQKGRSNFH